MGGRILGLTAAIAYISLGDNYHPVPGGAKLKFTLKAEAAIGKLLSGGQWALQKAIEPSASLSNFYLDPDLMAYLFAMTKTEDEGLEHKEEDLTIAAGAATLAENPIALFTIQEITTSGAGRVFKRVSATPEEGEFTWNGTGTGLVFNVGDNDVNIKVIYNYAETTGYGKLVLGTKALPPTFGMFADILHVTDPSSPWSRYAHILIKKATIDGEYNVIDIGAGDNPKDQEFKLKITNEIDGDVCFYYKM